VSASLLLSYWHVSFLPSCSSVSCHQGGANRLTISGPVSVIVAPPQPAAGPRVRHRVTPHPRSSSDGVSSAVGPVAQTLHEQPVPQRRTSAPVPARPAAAPASLQSLVGCEFVAVYDYTGQSETELSVQCGDRVRIVGVDDSAPSWYEAESLRTRTVRNATASIATATATSLRRNLCPSPFRLLSVLLCVTPRARHSTVTMPCVFCSTRH
jgi:hypothetical protein